MVDWVGNAQQAVQQEDWAQLVHCLQTVLQSEQDAEFAAVDRGDLVELAIAGLELGDFQTRWDLAKLMPRLGDAAIVPLVNLLQTDAADLEARWFAIRILGDSAHPAAIHALVTCLQTTDDEELSEMAAGALANLGDAAVQSLAALLSDPTTRGLAVQSLAQIRRSATIAPLLSVVRDPRPDLRAAAIEALSSFHDARIPPVLINALTDSASAVRRAAVIGLGVRIDQMTELNLLDLLGDRLNDDNPEVAQQAALALGRLGAAAKDHAAVDSLLQAARSPQATLSLQSSVVQSVAWIGTPSALRALQDLLDDRPSSQLRAEIITALGRWPNAPLHPAAAQLLIDQLSQPDLSLSDRQAIALALGQLHQPIALEPLIQQLAEEDASVRLHILAALKQLDWETAKQRLGVLQADPTLPKALQQGVAIALREWHLESPPEQPQ